MREQRGWENRKNREDGRTERTGELREQRGQENSLSREDGSTERMGELEQRGRKN